MNLRVTLESLQSVGPSSTLALPSPGEVSLPKPSARFSMPEQVSPAPSPVLLAGVATLGNDRRRRGGRTARRVDAGIGG